MSMFCPIFISLSVTVIELVIQCSSPAIAAVTATAALLFEEGGIEVLMCVHFFFIACRGIASGIFNTLV